ncbi:MAG: beta-lactamase family protein [Oscillospiraceae bacterium]|nr:beta-lactamase family protein [Oscillospiraceae bacterium]
MKNIQEELEKIVSKHLQPAYDRGYAVSVELNGKSLLKLYSGNAEDIEIDGIYHPVNANTPFDVASIAKQFVACCIAILACEKRLNLNDSIRVYLPEMKEYADKITIRHCISMTSGVRNFQLLKYFMSNSPLDDMEIFFRQEQPENEPGNFNSYSETCYELLGHIVERLTGGNALFAKQRIFEPLGMDDTQGLGIMGGGGMISTAEDLVKWHSCLMNRNLPGAPDGLFDMFFSSFTLNNGELCPYGFGFFYDENNRNIIWQYGDASIWQSVIRADLEKKLSIIILTHMDYDPVETALDLENTVLYDIFGLPERGNYKAAYYKRPIQTAETRQVKHHNFPNAQKQNPITDGNMDKYLGRYYGYEIDTYFDIVPDGSRFQMKYTDKDGDDYINLLDFADETQLMTRTRGKWGTFRFPIEFYGNEHKIDFFVLQRGIGVPFADDTGTRVGHFYFVKCLL